MRDAIRLRDAESTPAEDDRRATVGVVTDLEQIREEWIELAARARVSPYQTYAFMSAWADMIGRAEGASKLIVVARDASARAKAIFPLCVHRRAGLKIALFLGGRDSNFNLPILDPCADFGAAQMRALLREAMQACDDPPDLLYLRNQPRRFEGFDNPLVLPDARPSASFAYGATLPANVDALTARFSKDTRKKLKKKEARLAEIGPLAYEHCATGARGGMIIDALIRQKSARFKEMGVADSFERVGMAQFLQRLLRDGALETHALSVNGRIVATYAGVVRGGRFSAMLNSFDMDEAVAPFSPGDLLLHALMRDLVSRGMTHFDLGAGEARYKSAVCDETIELYDLVLPVSLRGALAAPLFSGYLNFKRRAKKSVRLSQAYHRVRRLIGR